MQMKMKMKMRCVNFMCGVKRKLKQSETECVCPTYNKLKQKKVIALISLPSYNYLCDPHIIRMIKDIYYELQKLYSLEERKKKVFNELLLFTLTLYMKD